MKRAVRLERVYPVSPERLFQALTDPIAMGKWLMENDFQPILGHDFQFRSKPQGSWDGVTHCTVVELEPPRRLAYSWRGHNQDGSPALADTLVRWTLIPEGDGTRLVLEHTGFAGFGEVMVSFLLGAGWKKMLATRLPAAMDLQPDQGGGTLWCRDIVLERALPYPPALVWRGVSERAVLAGWFMDNDLVLERGHPFTFRKNPQRGWDGITWCEVRDLDAPRSIAFSYRGRASGEKALACAGVDSKALQSSGKNVFTEIDTVLRFSVTPAGEGSLLRLEHRGFKGFSQVLVSLIMGAGWKKVLGRLPAALDAAARGEVLPPVR